VKLGTVSTEGTKIQGNASRHKVMGDSYMKKKVEGLREEIEAGVSRPTGKMRLKKWLEGVVKTIRCPTSYRVARRAGLRLKKRCVAWKHRRTTSTRL
jgi:hypothetical protein